jgi:hypothetical protein
MDLDELKQAWAVHDGKLDAVLRINRELLSANRLDRARSAMGRLAAGLAVEAVLMLFAVLPLGSFLHRHWTVLRFALPALALELGAIAVLAGTIRQMVGALGIDYRQPVAVVQRQVDSLRAARARFNGWILIASPLAWTPLVVVVFQGLFGVDMYRLPLLPWLAGNLLFGVAVLVIGLWASRRFAARMSGSPVLQRLMNALAGYNLKMASRSLEALSEFEDEKR